ncbi:MAG: hypothetical protein IT443_01715 [Phycisphaeraceae bacterium]|nr:hypothetical protein [Phycisphaeraceae bacterium]
MRVELNLSQAYATAAERSGKENTEVSPNVRSVAAMFGLGLDQDRLMKVVPATKLVLQSGQVVFVTGPSGGGKSTILRLIRQGLAERAEVRVVNMDELPPLAQGPLVDAFAGLELKEVLRLLGHAGLADAFVMLRNVAQLSDGQRWRARLAQALAAATDGRRPMVDGRGEGRKKPDAGVELIVILADEFAATLDRVTARTLARGVRRWVRDFAGDAGVCFVIATTHDDLLEPLEPDVLIEKHLGERLEIAYRETQV